MTALPNRRGYYSMARLEAFSDGVFAIAITLLVLDLVVPTRDSLHGRSLADALGARWPSYFAYLVSFAIIGIIWVNHHGLVSLAKTADRRMLFANLLLLLTVSVIPFPTRLLAEYLTEGGADSHTAAAVYSATMLAMGLAFVTLFLSMVHDPEQMHAPLDQATARATLRQFGIGNVAYLIAFGLSFVNAIATLILHAAFAVYYCFDQLALARTAEPGG